MGRSEKFYLGNLYDLQNNKRLNQQIAYDPDDLTTHAIITGMTGSGKTGLGLIFLEEAALAGIPAILIDPKGDLTNMMLHFPELKPADFQPWIDANVARREGKTPAEAAATAAELWKNGLSDWGIDQTRLEALSQAVDYAVYTPGSDAGFPVSILASLNAPPIPWEGNKEILREEISSTVTAILGLIGLKNIDPVRDREHILLANIFENAWQQNKDLDMAALITQVHTPPFEKLGIFPLERFYPEKDRFELAILLNNFLAAPAFQTWLEGQPLEIEQLLFTPKGKPRHSIFYTAHLSDEERMFFTTLLFTAIETWMRKQKGSGSLRAIVYFDEIAGYLPPVANPPSKKTILRMFKQARAFGLGLMLATQNPVDLDYKALSNAGTWIIGKLQTEQDKNRLLNGLEGAAPGVDRGDLDQIISQLDKRIFLLHNVHDDKPQVFHTRWAMNYLAGPITRTQLPALNALKGNQHTTTAAKDETPTPTTAGTTESVPPPEAPEPGDINPPVIPRSIPVFYLPADRGLSYARDRVSDRFGQEIPEPSYLYSPKLVGQARVMFYSKKHNISHETIFTIHMDQLKSKGLVHWENFLTDSALDPDEIATSPLPDATYKRPNDLPIDDTDLIKTLKKDFQEWIYRTQVMKLRVNLTLDVVAGPDESEAAFKARCQAAAEKKRDEEVEDIRQKYEKKLDAMESKLEKEVLELEEDKQVLNHRRMEEVGTGMENILSLFSGRRRRITTSLTKRRMTVKAKTDLEESQQTIKDLQEQMLKLEEDLKAELEAVSEKWKESIDQVVEEPVSPYKKNIFIELFGVLWIPHFAFKKDQGWITFSAASWENDG